MKKYLLKRIGYFIPGIFLIALVVFFLSRSFPNDPVIDYLANESGATSSLFTYDKYVEQYQQVSVNLGLDKPLFYFSILPSKIPDTLYKISILAERRHVKNLAYHYGDWEMTNAYVKAITANKFLVNKDIYKDQKEIRRSINQLFNVVDKNQIGSIIDFMIASDTLEHFNFTELKAISSKMINAKPSLKSWFPKLTWHGTHSQFHAWFGKILRFDFGISIKDGRRAEQKIKEALSWTLWINLVASILALLIAIFLGAYFALNRRKKRVGIISSLLYIFYAIPVFWLATILIVFFTSSEYGSWTNIFPSIASFLVLEDGPVMLIFFKKLSYFVLPVFCLFMPALAFLTRQMQSSIKEEHKKHYVRMLDLHGFSKKQMFWNHSFKNSMFPLITMLSTVIPFLFSGSLIVEVIFNIPGMGRLLYTSILAQDWNIVFAILLLISIITMISYLLVDILYASVNPKVKFNENG